MSRRYPALLVIALLAVGLGVVIRQSDRAETAVYSTEAMDWMPRAASTGGLTETWYCPGVPASGTDGVTGQVVVANRGGQPLLGTATIMNDAAENRRVELEVPAYASTTLDLDNLLPSEVVGAVVEVEGGGALVEQRSTSDGVTSRSACTNDTADEWYFADGFTVGDSSELIVLSNPYDQTVVARIELAVEDGYRTPGAYSSIAVPARSIRTVDLGAAGAGAQDEPVLAVKVEASRGRLVVGRAQQFSGGGRSGSQVSVASPTLGSQWWFPGGSNGDETAERYTVFNPTDRRVDVNVLLLGTSGTVGDDGLAAPLDVDPLDVPAFSAVTFDPASVDGLADGPYAAVFATLSEASIVVERATTVADGDDRNTSVVLGAIGRPEDGYVASQWHVVQAPDTPTQGALRVYNVDSAPGTITVYAVGPSGPVAVPSLTDLGLPAASSTLSIDLTDEAVLGRELIIEASNRMFVEAWFPSGVGGTPSVSWALPAG